MSLCCTSAVWPGFSSRPYPAPHLVALVFVLTFASPVRIVRADTLEGIKHAVHYSAGAPPASEENTDICRHNTAGCAEQRDPHTAALIFGFFFHLPHYLIENESEYHSEAQFLSYPYEGGAKGYMAPPLYKEGHTTPPETKSGDLLIGGAEKDTVSSPSRTRSFAIRLIGDYSFDLETIHKTSAYLLFETRWRWGVEAGFSYLYERFPDGNTPPEELSLGDVNIVFRFAQSKRIQMRTGVGGRYMVDGLGASFGVNFTYGADLYPVYPLVFSTVIDFGSLDRAFVLHARGSVGAVFRSFEAFAGWDVLQVGDAVVHGPLVGIRVWI
jgi:hypothetical protein